MGRRKGSKNKPKVAPIILPVVTVSTPLPTPPLKEKKKRKPRKPQIDNSVQPVAPKPPVEPKDKEKLPRKGKGSKPTVIVPVEKPKEEKAQPEQEENRGPFYMAANLSAIFLDKHPIENAASCILGILPELQASRMTKDAQAQSTTVMKLIIHRMLKGVGLDEETHKKVLTRISDYKPPVGQLFHRVKRS